MILLEQIQCLNTNIPPTIDKIISCLVATAIASIVPPIDNESVSPINHCWRH